MNVTRTVGFGKRVGRRVALAVCEAGTSKPALAIGAGMYALGAHAADPTDMDGIATWLTTNKATIIGVGVALIFLAIGKKLLRRGTG